tara:strand:+ start:157 stop:480 length:324 start_codon:yes stop_codon:yes gene_type:complete
MNEETRKMKINFDEAVTTDAGVPMTTGKDEANQSVTIGLVCRSLLTSDDNDASAVLLFSRARISEQIAGGGVVPLSATDVVVIVDLVKANVKSPMILMRVLTALGEG